ncbi:MAG: ABC transporter ATP-binding protein [Alphaproteobacteria bacterium]|jgi:putative ABC transport system ATP-binding protein|nr:ABC transporter ATP-binding protein [Alphaproteobacteria bacterium]
MMALIEASNLRKRYRMGGTAVQALDNVTFQVETGEFVAITGASGSGKTTLMNILGLLDGPSDGRYLLEGEDVGRLSSNQLAARRNGRIGFVFQSFNLLARSTALENVELPLVYAGVRRRKRRQIAEEALQRVGLAERRHHWPHQLSGGEQQRVAIARAVANRPALILADEPTGALDSNTGLEIVAQFEDLAAAGHTVLVVTHDPQVAKRAERTIALRDGRLLNDKNEPSNEPVEGPP